MSFLPSKSEVPSYIFPSLTSAFLPLLPLLPQLLQLLRDLLLYSFIIRCKMSSPNIHNTKHFKPNHPRLASPDPPRPRPPHTSPVRDWVTWRSWKTCAVDLLNIPKEMNTHDIYDAFNKYGNLISIDVWEDASGRPDSRGRIRFK